MLCEAALAVGALDGWAVDQKGIWSPECVDGAVTTGGTDRVMRGGGWRSAAEALHLSTRDCRVPTNRAAGIGVRCAREP
ncbi:hypothetical protein [Sorangium sp. So ce128]|uniref:hypothetical protein n=1 Tax=Sorangium sp. So ce128 TaxID=3133281 RepID=UPI003F5DCE3E